MHDLLVLCFGKNQLDFCTWRYAQQDKLNVGNEQFEQKPLLKLLFIHISL